MGGRQEFNIIQPDTCMAIRMQVQLLGELLVCAVQDTGVSTFTKLHLTCPGGAHASVRVSQFCTGDLFVITNESGPDMLVRMRSFDSHMHTCVDTYTYMQADRQTYMHIYVYLYIEIYIYIYMFMCSMYYKHVCLYDLVCVHVHAQLFVLEHCVSMKRHIHTYSSCGLCVFVLASAFS